MKMLAIILFPVAAFAQQSIPEGFSWVSPLDPAEAVDLTPRVRHAAYKSPSMGIDVGYYIYLPRAYSENSKARFPVVYALHGGRPGGEHRIVRLANIIDEAIEEGKLKPAIYVYPNGGPMSWYNYPSFENGMGEDVFVKETIPHIDATYRTLGDQARGIEGYSQGGRGTTRLYFKYPELFVSVAPGGSGYGPEKTIQENDGWESDKIRFLPVGHNTWDLAAAHARKPNRQTAPMLLWVGTEEAAQYPWNVKFSAYLDELGIEHVFVPAPGLTHGSRPVYEMIGYAVMKFHESNFEKALAK